MRFRFYCATVLFAAPLATALVAAAQQSAAPTLSPPSDVAAPAISAGQPALNGGVSPRSPSKSDIQTLLGQVTEAATGKGELPTLVSYLSKADRDAIGDVRAKQWADLDGRADQFHKDWQAMFGISFKLSDKQSVIYSDESFPVRPAHESAENATTGLHAGAHKGATPLAGPTTQPAAGTMPSNMSAMGGSTSMPADMSAMGGPTTTPSAYPNVPPTGADTMGENPSQNEEMNVRSGTVELPASGDQPPLTLHLINEGTMVPSWKIDLPTAVTAQRLHDSLLRRLTWLDEHRASWPTEINEAYQAVSREMLAALIDAGGSGATTQP